MKSEWIMDIGEVWICRNCGEPCKEHFMGKPRWNYCPWCGADMTADRKTEPQKDVPILTAEEWAKIKKTMPESRLILFDDDGNYIEPQTERSE